MGATSDLFEHLFGHIAKAPDVAAQFESDRLDLAKLVWARMKETDSRECRNCHSFEAMVLAAQPMRAQGQHEFAVKKNMTCIDCHKGLVHKPIHQQLEKPAEAESFE
jgi:cytochrome c-type protein NapC